MVSLNPIQLSGVNDWEGALDRESYLGKSKSGGFAGDALKWEVWMLSQRMGFTDLPTSTMHEAHPFLSP